MTKRTFTFLLYLSNWSLRYLEKLHSCSSKLRAVIQEDSVRFLLNRLNDRWFVQKLLRAFPEPSESQSSLKWFLLDHECNHFQNFWTKIFVSIHSTLYHIEACFIRYLNLLIPDWSLVNKKEDGTEKYLCWEKQNGKNYFNNNNKKSGEMFKELTYLRN